MHILRTPLLIAAALIALTATAESASAQSASTRGWNDIVAQARGQTVFFNAWAGSKKINDFIDWVAGRVSADYGITLRHVKLDDTATAVTRVLAEKQAGRTQGGSVDLVWINGENFAAMKENGLLGAPFAADLPNFRLVDVRNKPTVLSDFTVPTDGLESPWGQAQLVFMYDTARLADPPRSMQALLAWAKANPGRFTYPEPPNFTGTTFLKQALIQLTNDPGALTRPATDENFARVTAPLWNWLAALTPQLWRQGRAYPANSDALRQILDDNEIDIAMTFEPAGASSAIARGLLPDSVRTYVMDGGTIGNSHFVAIPFNASARAGAMVVANFLLTPEAQARKLDPAIWGDFTVLDVNALPAGDRALFAAVPRGIATLSPEALAPTLAEPHPSWVTRIEDEWRRRLVRAN